MEEYPMYWGLTWYWWLFLVLLFVIIGIAVAKHAERVAARRNEDAALEELRRRFLEGEITAEEYRARKAVLVERKRAA